MTAPDSGNTSRHLRGLLLLLTTVLMWSIGPLFIKYFTHLYDSWTQNAFRYGCAAAMLALFSAVRGDFRYRLTGEQWKRLALVAVPNVLLQTAYCASFYFVYPSVVILVSRTQVLFVIVLSFLIFHDERQVIRSPRFLMGMVMALVGVALVIFGRDLALLTQLKVSERGFWIGTGLAIIYSLFGAVYVLAIKRAVRDIPPLLSFTHVSWMTTLGLTVPMLFSGGYRNLFTQPAWGLGLMALSALLAIAIAHTAYFAALRDVTAVTATSMLQLMPVLTCLFSALLYHDLLSPLQLIGGGAVLLGTWFAALVQAKEENAVAARI